MVKFYGRNGLVLTIFIISLSCPFYFSFISQPYDSNQRRVLSNIPRISYEYRWPSHFIQRSSWKLKLEAKRLSSDEADEEVGPEEQKKKPKAVKPSKKVKIDEIFNYDQDIAGIEATILGFDAEFDRRKAKAVNSRSFSDDGEGGGGSLSSTQRGTKKEPKAEKPKKEPKAEKPKKEPKVKKEPKPKKEAKVKEEKAAKTDKRSATTTTAQADEAVPQKVDSSQPVQATIEKTKKTPKKVKEAKEEEEVEEGSQVKSPKKEEATAATAAKKEKNATAKKESVAEKKEKEEANAAAAAAEKKEVAATAKKTTTKKTKEGEDKAEGEGGEERVEPAIAEVSQKAEGGKGGKEKKAAVKKGKKKEVKKEEEEDADLAALLGQEEEEKGLDLGELGLSLEGGLEMGSKGGEGDGEEDDDEDFDFNDPELQNLLAAVNAAAASGSSSQGEEQSSSIPSTASIPAAAEEVEREESDEALRIALRNLEAELAQNSIFSATMRGEALGEDEVAAFRLPPEEEEMLVGEGGGGGGEGDDDYVDAQGRPVRGTPLRPPPGSDRYNRFVFEKDGGEGGGEESGPLYSRLVPPSQRPDAFEHFRLPYHAVQTDRQLPSAAPPKLEREWEPYVNWVRRFSAAEHGQANFEDVDGFYRFLAQARNVSAPGDDEAEPDDYEEYLLSTSIEPDKEMKILYDYHKETAQADQEEMERWQERRAAGLADKDEEGVGGLLGGEDGSWEGGDDSAAELFPLTSAFSGGSLGARERRGSNIPAIRSSRYFAKNSPKLTLDEPEVDQVISWQDGEPIDAYQKENYLGDATIANYYRPDPRVEDARALLWENIPADERLVYNASEAFLEVYVRPQRGALDEDQEADAAFAGWDPVSQRREVRRLEKEHGFPPREPTLFHEKDYGPFDEIDAETEAQLLRDHNLRLVRYGQEGGGEGEDKAEEVPLEEVKFFKEDDPSLPPITYEYLYPRRDDLLHPSSRSAARAEGRELVEDHAVGLQMVVPNSWLPSFSSPLVDCRAYDRFHPSSDSQAEVITAEEQRGYEQRVAVNESLLATQASTSMAVTYGPLFHELRRHPRFAPRIAEIMAREAAGEALSEEHIRYRMSMQAILQEMYDRDLIQQYNDLDDTKPWLDPDRYPEESRNPALYPRDSPQFGAYLVHGRLEDYLLELRRLHGSYYDEDEHKAAEQAILDLRRHRIQLQLLQGGEVEEEAATAGPSLRLPQIRRMTIERLTAIAAGHTTPEEEAMVQDAEDVAFDQENERLIRLSIQLTAEAAHPLEIVRVKRERIALLKRQRQRRREKRWERRALRRAYAAGPGGGLEGEDEGEDDLVEDDEEQELADLLGDDDAASEVPEDDPLALILSGRSSLDEVFDTEVYADYKAEVKRLFDVDVDDSLLSRHAWSEANVTSEAGQRHFALMDFYYRLLRNQGEPEPFVFPDEWLSADEKRWVAEGRHEAFEVSADEQETWQGFFRHWRYGRYKEMKQVEDKGRIRDPEDGYVEINAYVTNTTESQLGLTVVNAVFAFLRNATAADRRIRYNIYCFTDNEDARVVRDEALAKALSNKNKKEKKHRVRPGFHDAMVRHNLREKDMGYWRTATGQLISYLPIEVHNRVKKETKTNHDLLGQARLRQIQVMERALRQEKRQTRERHRLEAELQEMRRQVEAEVEAEGEAEGEEGEDGEASLAEDLAMLFPEDDGGSSGQQGGTVIKLDDAYFQSLLADEEDGAMGRKPPSAFKRWLREMKASGMNEVVVRPEDLRSPAEDEEDEADKEDEKEREGEEEEEDSSFLSPIELGAGGEGSEGIIHVPSMSPPRLTSQASQAAKKELAAAAALLHEMDEEDKAEEGDEEEEEIERLRRAIDQQEPVDEEAEAELLARMTDKERRLYAILQRLQRQTQQAVVAAETVEKEEAELSLEMAGGGSSNNNDDEPLLPKGSLSLEVIEAYQEALDRSQISQAKRRERMEEVIQKYYRQESLPAVFQLLENSCQMWIEGTNVYHLIDGVAMKEAWGRVVPEIVLSERNLQAILQQVLAALGMELSEGAQITDLEQTMIVSDLNQYDYSIDEAYVHDYDENRYGIVTFDPRDFVEGVPAGKGYWDGR